jgi:hypothetical protein
MDNTQWVVLLIEVGVIALITLMSFLMGIRRP